MTSLVIVDAPTVNNADSAEKIVLDAGKTVSGVKHNELGAFAVLPKRWIVERSCRMAGGWLEAPADSRRTAHAN